MSLLDFKLPGMDTPEGQGLLSAAFSLLQARRMPGRGRSRRARRGKLPRSRGACTPRSRLRGAWRWRSCCPPLVGDNARIAAHVRRTTLAPRAPILAADAPEELAQVRHALRLGPLRAWAALALCDGRLLHRVTPSTDHARAGASTQAASARRARASAKSREMGAVRDARRASASRRTEARNVAAVTGTPP